MKRIHSPNSSFNHHEIVRQSFVFSLFIFFISQYNHTPDSQQQCCVCVYVCICNGDDDHNKMKTKQLKINI